MCVCAMKSLAACDDGYIDCGPLALSSRKSQNTPSNAERRRESVPLLSKSAARCGGRTSVEDLGGGAPPATMYRCWSRSGSIGSQLSAAASSTAIHKDSLTDLAVLGACNPQNDYLPMSPVGAPKRSNSAVSAGTLASQSSKQGNVKKSPADAFSRGRVCPKSAENFVSQSSGNSTPSAVQSVSIVPSSMTASYRNVREEPGYLLFQPTGAVSTNDDQNSGDSLERLGPPPEIPTAAAVDYMVPLPKQHTSGGMRANSMQLTSKPHIVPRRRGSVESSGPAVPLRENRGSTLAGISKPSVAISSRPAAQRLASRKPNLTVDAVASANTVNSGAFFNAGSNCCFI